ncbi:hypothetical protein B0H11DRAFT_1982343 [Mycena galericulata]|nr:hypothetical protein B0H11DRAFT_1982343 [Mycena galericulata]
MQLPFSLSYLILTPRHVRLPGQLQVHPRDKATSSSPRWHARLVAGTKSLGRTSRGSASSPPGDGRGGPDPELQQ